MTAFGTERPRDPIRSGSLNLDTPQSFGGMKRSGQQETRCELR
jgi:hypothetical protein